VDCLRDIRSVGKAEKVWHKHAHIRTHIRKHTCSHTRTRTCMHALIHTHTHTHTNIHTRAHTPGVIGGMEACMDLREAAEGNVKEKGRVGLQQGSPCNKRFKNCVLKVLAGRYMRYR